MRFHKSSQACLLLLVHAVVTVTGVNFTQCLNDIKSTPSNASDATAISYSMCITSCGVGQESYQWSVFSLDNLMSALLTVGSPALAGYSLFITLLNSRWINRRFDHSVNHPNSRFAVSILSSLQQVPLRYHPDRARLYSLIVLPENDSWWKYLAEFVDYTHTWSIASATSIAWVIVAYILTVANSLSDVYADIQSNGEASGSMWLWLIPIVVGWLQLSPKCDFSRLQAAYERSDQHSLRTGAADVHTKMLPASSRRALAITAKEDVMSPDEFLTPPVFNYSRSLRWASTAETMYLMFKVASEKAHSLPFDLGSEHAEFDAATQSDTTRDTDDRGYFQDAVMYCAQPGDAQSSHWAPGVFTRMAIASCASLALQWGTVGAALVVGWFTPTTGMGCRLMGYLIHGIISTLIWMMLLMSSILAHHSAAHSRRTSLSARVSFALSHFLRWTGKLWAIINFFLVVLACVFQYSNFYDRCFCNSSVFSRRGAAYAVIIETAAQAKAAWIGALALACTSASFFLGVVYLLLDAVPS